MSATELIAHERITPGHITMPSGDVRPMNSYERAKVKRYQNRSGLHEQYDQSTSAGTTPAE